MTTPLISVLMPARNAAPTVEGAARSILEQSLRDLELIAVDDGSSDETGRILARLAREDARARLVQGPGQGLVRALWAGLPHCRAPYLARMDADDVSLPSRLEKSVAALEADPRLAAVGTAVEVFREDRPVSPNMQLCARWLGSLTTPELLFADRLVESPLCHPSVTMRKAALEAAGGFEEGDFPEDWQLWLKLLSRGFGLKNLPEVLLRWRDRDSRLTRTDPRYSKRSILRLKARYLGEVLPRGRPSIVWGAGELGLALSRLLRAEGFGTDRFIEVSPRKLGQRIEGAPVVAPASLGPPGELHLVAAVGAKGARQEIRERLSGLGWQEGRHFTCAA
ncbi:MAG: glycosyltransferase [Myxococcales bacterium]|nr:glycosyltransferase [Myxococcales bacterium]